ncbi:hypothetical protein [Alienimonas sp. DA493]|uniref:hypothetical protein n=1 Tax=Alienimonas sp. DA493 TaxID=3373605 RepID=UPI0037544635
MKTLEIKPRIGVGPIRFGMTRDALRKHLGEPDADDAAREWYLEDMAIDFDPSGSVVFVELARSENYKAMLNGKCLHELDADQAVAHLQAIAPYDENDPELGYAYRFPELQMSLWRPAIPDGEQAPDDPTGRCFESVGVGGEGYFNPE